MEPYEGPDLATWKEEVSSSEDDDKDGDGGPVGYIIVKRKVKKLYKDILTLEELIQ
jgi:hypothetical protein